MNKIIIDTDPGTDDFIAISLALKSNKFDVLGITTVEGNCSLDNATKNAFKVLNMCGRDDIEVYKGLENSHLNTKNALDIHGNNGLGGVEYTPIDRIPNDMNAIDYLINTVNSNPGEITVVAIGPLTNIAACIDKDNNFVENVKELIIMGGSATFGNIVPHAEFNFYKDPESANKVVTAPFKSIKIFGWDVTTQAPMVPEYEERFKVSESKFLNYIYDITRVASKRDSVLYGGAVISDPLTIAYLIDSDICTMEYANVEVIVDGVEAGKSIVNFVDSSNCKFATSVAAESFYKLIFDIIC